MKPEPRTSPLGTTILKNVSRTFYLSLRLLPSGMRDAAGLGYLLARSSDTLADTATLSVELRLAQLDGFAQAVAHNRAFCIATEVLEACTPAEKILLDSIDDQLSWLNQLDQSVQELIRDVLAVICSGQRLDLMRFGHANDQQQVSLSDDTMLRDYCHRVAGCVGLFWTRLGYHAEGKNFATANQHDMEQWGQKLGCGLQLVNILRDRPEDMANGRFYLPNTAQILSDEEQWHAQDRWIAEARECIHMGLRYASQLKNRRTRCATVLPALLALETLELLQKATWNQIKQRIKISKGTVLRCLGEAWLYPYEADA